MLEEMTLCSAAEAAEDGGSPDVEDHDERVDSTTDVSDDSVEVHRITGYTPAKRKLGAQQPQQQSQPKGDAPCQPGQPCTDKRTALSPSPKRRRPSSPLSPFRPWSAPSPAPGTAPARSTVPASVTAPLPPLNPQEEPLALVKTRVSTGTPTVPVIPRSPRGSRSTAVAGVTSTAPKPPSSRFSVEDIIGDVVSRPAPPSTPAGNPRSTKDGVRWTVDHGSSFGGGPAGGSSVGVEAAGGGSSTHGSTSSGRAAGAGTGGGQQRNYKNMTRERRIEANARERTRVHTISAAFDTLRRSVPAYSHSQKLSKLSVLRIACSYILTLSRVAGMDYSADQSRPPVQDCVDLVTRTIQTEGKLRRKKDD